METLNLQFFNLFMQMITELNRKVTPQQLSILLDYSSVCSMICADNVLNGLNENPNVGEYWAKIKEDLLKLQKND